MLSFTTINVMTNTKPDNLDIHDAHTFKQTVSVQQFMPLYGVRLQQGSTNSVMFIMQFILYAQSSYYYCIKIRYQTYYCKQG